MKRKNVATLVKTPGIAILRSFDLIIQVFTRKPAVLQAELLPFTKILSDNREAILSEYISDVKKKVPQNVKDFYKVETDINVDDNWKAVPLILFGYTFKENCQRYPRTLEVLNQIPGCAGAMFSVLGPGKHIPPHHGIYKGIYRCLFTLKVKNAANCWIRVNNNKIMFETGKCIVFDETANHEVLNDSDEPRIVLYLDIYRKLSFPLNFFNDFIFALLRKSPFVKNIVSEYSKLENVSIEDYKWFPAVLS